MGDAILLTGAGGYLGSHCIAKLAEHQYREIIATWHSSSKRLWTRPPRHVRYVRCDLGNYREVAELFRERRIGTVIHAAALLPDGAPSQLQRAILANIAASANLAETAAQAGCGRFVFCSTISVFGRAKSPSGGWDESAIPRPDCYYGWSKLAAEDCISLVCEASGMAGIGLRLAGIHGAERRGGVVYHMLRAALADETLRISNPQVPFQFLFIDDAVEAVFRAMTADLGFSYQNVHVASQCFTSMRDLAEKIVSCCGVGKLPTSSESINCGGQIMDTTRMRNLLRPEFADFESGLEKLRLSLEKTARGV